MKKLIAFILAAVLLLSVLTGCGKKETVESPQTEETFAPEAEAPTPEVEKEEAPKEEAPAVEEEKPSTVTPSEKEEPAAPVVPKEEAPKKEEPVPAEPTVEEPKEEPAVQIPSETPVLPPSSVVTPEEVPEETPSVPVSMSLTEIIDAIYRINDPILPAVSMPVDLNDAYSLTSFTGLSDASKITEAVASESMMGAQAYSLVLVRLKDAADAQTVAQAMRNGIDQRKWICVNADDIRVVACGDVVMLCMISSQLDVKVNDMVSAFGTVMNSAFSVDIS